MWAQGLQQEYDLSYFNQKQEYDLYFNQKQK